jgi:hypothetical protein
VVCRQKSPPGGPAFDESLLFYHASLIKQIAGPTSDNHGEAGARAAQMEAESCRISHRMHFIQFRQIIRDAEIAYVISPVVRRHRLSAEETEKFLLELRIPRAANVAGITDRLVVFQKSQLADKLLTKGELRTRGPELIARS